MKGSPVRVRASALRKPRKRGVLFWPDSLATGRNRDFVPNLSRRRRTIRDAMSAVRPPSGHVFRVEGKRRPVWYAKFRLPDGRQVQKRIGPAWTERGRPPAGYVTKRGAEDWLRKTLDQVRRG